MKVPPAPQLMSAWVLTFFPSSVSSEIGKRINLLSISATSTDEMESVGETYVKSMFSDSKNPSLPCSGLIWPLLFRQSILLKSP